MDQSIRDRLSRSFPVTLDLFGNATGLQESEDGRSPSNSRIGLPSAKFGPHPFLVSRFRSQEQDKALSTDATSGPLFTASSPSAGLQSSLESRLRALMDVNGSPEFALTWRSLDMPSGPSLCRLAPSVRRTGGSGSTGAPWPTPNTPNGGRSPKGGMSMTGMTEDRIKRQVDLQHVARETAAWATPKSTDATAGPDFAMQTRHPSAGLSLPTQAAFGPTPSGESAQTGKRGALNPAFVCWLMGYPTAWARCAASVTRSSRKSQRSS